MPIEEVKVFEWRDPIQQWDRPGSRDVHAPIAGHGRAKIRSIPYSLDTAHAMLVATALGADLNQSHLQATHQMQTDILHETQSSKPFAQLIYTTGDYLFDKTVGLIVMKSKSRAKCQ